MWPVQEGAYVNKNTKERDHLGHIKLTSLINYAHFFHEE